MILLDSIHFMEIHNAISLRSIQWDNINTQQQQNINDNDIDIIKNLEKNIFNKNNNSNTKVITNIDSNIILSLLNFLKNSDDLISNKYVINLFTEFLINENFYNQIIDFFNNNNDKLLDFYNISFKSSNLIDDQLILISTFNIVSLLINQKNLLLNINLVEKILTNKFFLKILSNLNQLDTSYVCIRLLQELATIKSYRNIIWNYQNSFLPILFTILNNSLTNTNLSSTNSNNLGIQIQYHSLLLIWILTFNNDYASQLTKNYLQDFLNLLKIINITIKEKISRLCVSIILQCCNDNVKNYKQNIKNLILLGNGINIIKSLNDRKKFSDDELRDDLIKLKDLLENEYQELTSFDEYIAEIDSKLLCWSPPHTDNGFWSDNIDKFKDENWKIFKKLINILKEYQNNNLNDKNIKIIIEVALNDITHVIQLLPESIDILNIENCKIVIMELLNHTDSKVKYEALKATQAMIGYNF